jgi:5-methylcytosine-specific restriction endonuclease McrA
MKPVKPNKKITLVLTAAFQPIGFFNARSSIRNIIVGGARAVDNDGTIYSWEQWNSRTDFPSDQPSLRTTKNEFPVPTIIVIPGFFGKFDKISGKKKNRTSSLRQIFNLYDGVCQYCLKDIKYGFATKDHVLPKSRGGKNFDTNIVLSCKKCNNKKASKFPFYNIRGEEVTVKKVSDIDFYLQADNVEIRPEWAPFLNK